MADWNTDFEAIPADAENISQGAERIRGGKEITREVIAADHVLDPTSESHDDDGKHKQVSLVTLNINPTYAIANTTTDPEGEGGGGLHVRNITYTDPTADANELVYTSAPTGSNTRVQLTLQGSNSAIPVGSRMLFVQATTPLGWTLENDHADRLPLIVDPEGTDTDHGGQAGGVENGNWDMTGLSSKDDDTLPGQTEGVQLTTANMARHTHYVWMQTRGIVGETNKGYASGKDTFVTGAEFKAGDDERWDPVDPGHKQLDTMPTTVADESVGTDTPESTIFETRPEGGSTALDNGTGDSTGPTNGLSGSTDDNYVKSASSDDHGEEHSHEIKNGEDAPARLAILKSWRPNYVTTIECSKDSYVVS